MSNEIQKMNDQTMAQNDAVFCSLHAETQEDRVKIYNAINSSKALDDYIGKVLQVKDVVIQPVEIENERTGEVEQARRIVLIDVEGNAYATVSKGVSSAMRNIFAIIGVAPWETALKLKPVKRQGSHGFKFTTLEIEG